MAEFSKPRSILLRFSEETESFSPGQTIFTTGQAGDAMYIVKEGEVHILVSDKVVETVGAEGIFGEMALIDHSPRSASAVAATACELVRINAERFKFLVKMQPDFAIEVMRTMATRLRNMDALL